MADQNNKRDIQLPLAVNQQEQKIIDGFRDKLQLVSPGKVSRADAVLKAIRFADGQMLLK